MATCSSPSAGAGVATMAVAASVSDRAPRASSSSSVRAGRSRSVASLSASPASMRIRVRRWSDMSRVIFENPRSLPVASKTGAITVLAQYRVPSLRTRQPSMSSRPLCSACSRFRSGTPAATSAGV